MCASSAGRDVLIEDSEGSIWPPSPALLNQADTLSKLGGVFAALKLVSATPLESEAIVSPIQFGYRSCAGSATRNVADYRSKCYSEICHRCFRAESIRRGQPGWGPPLAWGTGSIDSRFGARRSLCFPEPHAELITSFASYWATLLACGSGGLCRNGFAINLNSKLFS